MEEQSSKQTRNGSKNTTQEWNATREEAWDAWSDLDQTQVAAIAKKFDGKFEKGMVYEKTTD